jgi:uncharacterized membrane protein YeaQ/YmgE (transglycosylase-associated protein family)
MRSVLLRIISSLADHRFAGSLAGVSTGAIYDASSSTGRRRMSIIGWIFLGLISGFIASKVVNKSGSGVILDIVLGIVGAFVGGLIFTGIGGHGVTGFNVYSMVVSVTGAIVVLVIYHMMFDRRIY